MVASLVVGLGSCVNSVGDVCNRRYFYSKVPLVLLITTCFHIAGYVYEKCKGDAA